MTIKQIKKKHDENEDNNCHAENLVLLANHFGTEQEQALAEENLKAKHRLGHLDSKLNNECYSINRYYKKLIN